MDDDRPLALVTGAARRLGKSLALALAGEGYSILLHYHASAQEAARTAAEIAALGAPAYPVQADLTTDAGIAALVAALEERLRASPAGLKILVNSAGVMPRADLASVSAATWDAAFALNLRAPFLLAQAAARRMTDGGLIVNITDVGAQKHWLNYPTYVVSKSALETLTRLQARAYAPAVRVNAIAPGLVMPPENFPHEEWERLVKRLPLQRETAVEEIVSALQFLIRNRMVTGQTLTVDGGYALL